jgi:signal transduction histidine kinase
MKATRQPVGARKAAAKRERARIVAKVGAHPHRRLLQLYEVSKLLTVFEDVEETVRTVLSRLARTLPLRSAILLLGATAWPRTLAWKSRAIGDNGLKDAIAHARAAYPYLVGSATVAISESTASVHEIAGGLATTAVLPKTGPDRFILLPLVVGGRPIFGALQVEVAEEVEESDLAFVNAVVNQLALAIDRYAAIEAAQTAEQAKLRAAEDARALAETAGKVQQFLAELSSALAISPQYSSALASCARLTVPYFADLCVIDEVAKDGSLTHVEVAFADATTHMFVSQILEPPGPWRTRQAEVIETGQAVLVHDADPSDGGEARVLLHMEGKNKAYPASTIVAPLIVRDQTFGLITFAMAGSRRRYVANDVNVAVEVARRTAMAIDNAKLHEGTERAVQQRQDILAIVSHDLRNPLGSILGVTQILLSAPSTDETAEDRKKIALIQRSANRMNRMIADLLDLSSIDAGHLSMDVKAAALTPLVAEVVDNLRRSAQDKEILLHAHLPSEEIVFFCDRLRVMQVLLNLVGNAIKFTASGGSVEVSAELHATNLLVRVTDDGPGIPKERLAHVFERYWQARETAAAGMGLGLYISKGIVDAHGGSIGVESIVGEGSTFFFTLPLSPPA